MADRQRNLNIPIYNIGVVPEGTVLEDMIEAEVIEDEPTLGERVRARARRSAESVADAARNTRTHGARDTFFTRPADNARAAAGDADERVRARQDGRARREEQTRVRGAQAADAKSSRAARSNLEREAQLDPLAKLKLDTVRAGEQYMDSLRRSGILATGQTQATQRKQLSDMHQVYASMMVLQCVEPLQQGLSAQNIVSALGMGASMWLLSPNFRVQVGNFAGQVGDVIREKIQDRESKKDAKAQSRFERLASRGKGDQLAGKWQRRLDRVEHAERGHRLPFTAQSAAMTEVALAEAAYADMRRPGADRAAIQERYQSALSTLYGYVDDDGIGREDVSRSMRVIVGQRLEHDPSLASVFSELGHGRYTKSEPREVFINGTTDTATVWTGDFVDSYEGRTIVSGSFRLRPVMGVDEHRVLSSETIAADLVSAKTPQEMNDTLSQYLVAASVGEYPDVVDELENQAARARFGKVRSMFATMQADGLTADQQHFAYGSAYVDAVEIAHRLKPELSAAWVAQYGENWRERVAEDIGHYKDMGAAAEREKRGPAEPSAGQRFTARSDARYQKLQHPAEEPSNAEDIVDAEVIHETHLVPEPREEAAGHKGRRLEESIYEGELVDDTLAVDAEAIDGEVIETPAIGTTSARAAILAGAMSTATEAEEGQDHTGSSRTSAKVQRARVNQHYNEIETGEITGFGSDSATPLQDVDFELG